MTENESQSMAAKETGTHNKLQAFLNKPIVKVIAIITGILWGAWLCYFSFMLIYGLYSLYELWHLFD